MPKTQVACPQSRQPILVEVQQIFDLAQDPLAKQKLLNGAVNVIHCPACGYSGMLGTPIVYHDPEKELFLTFFPPESGVPLNEQERQLGPMINRVIDALPAEKRKAYILQPKSMLTYQTLIESVLEADGITKEMLEEQQKKIHLIQRLLTAPETELETIIEQEKELIDLSFFALYSRLLQSAVAQNDEESARQLDKVQKVLFEKTEVGKELYKSSQETQQAIKELQEAGKDGGLTREKLLDVVLNAKSDAALSAIVSLARNGMDYTFFQLLSQKIDAAKDKEKESLVTLRENLLNLTSELDKRMQAEVDKTKELLESIVKAENIEAEAEKNLENITELFLHVVEDEIEKARKQGDLERIQKLERVMIVIRKAMEPPQEVKLIEEMLALVDKQDELEKFMDAHQESITPELVQLLNGILSQAGNAQDEGYQKFDQLYKAVLRYSMKKNLAAK
ncbi:MAG TPA: CpXC domain-containing protein [Anaerolineaceae bacterium]|nr:CpXC domain-containing protein [Anaerolineaceae bacterium]